ncbi:MAG: hypothetical protein HYX28_09465 [Candidatus Koribacter versatilis]|uniref:Uncharacterized protein n=1 Tax=Candidatus Korobacter versatilis TaxID=658062 RepID=A0A932A9F3_9BACT|nr:hypothetical protein [Candidatus Koribacter versatilis]
MGKINWKRAIAGGLVAGFLYDLFEIALSPFVAGRQYEAELNAIRHTPPSAAGYAFFIAWGFVIGVVAVCVYAAVRPRLGPGPRTAAKVALALWVLADLMPQMAQAVMGIFTFNLMIKFTLQQLFFMLATTIVGAWVYREGDAV